MSNNKLFIKKLRNNLIIELFLFKLVETKMIDMKIIKIKHLKKTDEEDYTLITFSYKRWFKTLEKTEICITPNWNIGTKYAKSYNNIPTSLWDTVKSFIRTGDKEHDYIKQELK